METFTHYPYQVHPRLVPRKKGEITVFLMFFNFSLYFIRIQMLEGSKIKIHMLEKFKRREHAINVAL